MNRLFSWSLAVASLFAIPSGVLANNYVANSQGTVNVVIDDAFNWVVLRSVTVNILPFFDPGSHGCTVNASADVYWTGGSLAEAENRYRFAIVRNNTNPVTGGATERTLAMVDHAGSNDPNYYPISVTAGSGGLTSDNGAGGGGAHTFYLLGRKAAPEDPNVTVGDSSLSAMCVHTP
jgi:hypothetical protein